MFGTSRKLYKWLEVGLINDEQLSMIVAHEKDKGRALLNKGVIGIALFAILVGVLSIVAANWAYIGKEVKLFAHLFLNMLAAYGVYYGSKHSKAVIQEGSLFVLFGLNLTMIALIGQVFQLPGDILNALMLWLVISTPAILFYGRTFLTGLPWIFLFPIVSVTFIWEYLLVDIELSNFWFAFIFQFIVVLLPFLFILWSRCESFRVNNPSYSNIFIRLSYIFIMIGATISTFFLYEDTTNDYHRVFNDFVLYKYSEQHFLTYIIFEIPYIILFLGFICLWKFRNGYVGNDEGKGLFFIALVSLITVFLCFAIPHDNSDVMAMISFIAYWFIIAVIGFIYNFEKIITLAIGLISIRIFIIYLEAFGGLLSTGFGLISSGVVLLVMIYGFKKINSYIKLRREV